MNIVVLLPYREPPCTEPYARWCGSQGRETASATRCAPGMARSVMNGAWKGCSMENGEGTRRSSPGPEKEHRPSLGAKHAMQSSPEERREKKLSTGERKRTGK
jgi:hypothetical protein